MPEHSGLQIRSTAPPWSEPKPAAKPGTATRASGAGQTTHPRFGVSWLGREQKLGSVSERRRPSRELTSTPVVLWATRWRRPGTRRRHRPHPASLPCTPASTAIFPFRHKLRHSLSSSRPAALYPSSHPPPSTFTMSDKAPIAADAVAAAAGGLKKTSTVHKNTLPTAA